MSHHLGLLMYDDGIQVREIFNHARTIEHLRNSGIGCATVGIQAEECAVLSLDQCDYTPVEFTTPDDIDNPAPWYDGTPGSPSAGGYGFWINEWTGLDGSNVRRSASTIYPRGATFGPLGQAHRVWKMNVTLFGSDAVALEDLFRWLEENLIACCSPGVTAWIRTTCPDGYDNDYGLVHVVDLQLLEGVEWIDPPIESLGCFMRRVSFTLGVGDPCLYRPPVECLEDEVFTHPAAAILVSGGSNETVRQTSFTAPRWDVSGDLEFIFVGYLNDWTPASLTTLFSWDDAGAGNRGHALYVTSSGALQFVASIDGSTFGISHTTTALISSVAPAAGVLLWIGVRRSAVNGVVEFRYSYDGEEWELLEFSVEAAGTLNEPPNEQLFVGFFLAGAVARFEVWEGFKGEGGTLASLMDPNESDPPGTSTWTSAAGGGQVNSWAVAAGDVSFGTYGDIMSLCGIGLEGIFGCNDGQDAMVDYRLCCNVAGERIGATAPVVVIQNLSTTSYSPPLRLVGITDNGSGCLVANNEIFGEVRVSGFPPQSALMIDCARRRILWRPLGFIRPWEPGYVYLDRSIDVVPDYPAVGCNDAIIFIEPTTITPSLVDLSVTAWMVGRYGCC